MQRKDYQHLGMLRDGRGVTGNPGSLKAEELLAVARME